MHISVEAIGTRSRKRLTLAPRQIIHVCSALSLFAFGGCAVLQGAPSPATDVSQENTAFAIYLTGDVLERAVSPNNADRNGMTQLQWRDAVIAARLQIMDQNFQAFKNQFRAQVSGLNLGTDLASLGLTAAAAVTSGGTAKALAAASTGVIGVGTAFNKDALFQQTLPAIFAQMDASRSSVLIRIRQAQAQADVTKYPLALALTDLSAYERAGTIDSATATLTQNAGDQAAKNQVELENLNLGTPVDARVKTLSAYIQTLVANKDTASLTKIAKALQISVPANADYLHIKALIVEYIDKYVYGKTSEKDQQQALDDQRRSLHLTKRFETTRSRSS
jgi:hypothetical protein